MMNEEKEKKISRMSRLETVVALCWLPMHILLLPIALTSLFPAMSQGRLNFWVYAIGAGVLALLCVRFLHRDFESLLKQPGRVLKEILISYGLILLGNLLVNLLLNLLLPAGNPNNLAVMDLARKERGEIVAATVLLAPILEELMFRAGLFGLLRRRSRVLAYAVCMLLFAAYHVWPYALEDPRNWLYLLQYAPVTFVLCRCYERTETIWASIFLHMLVNGVSMWMLSAMESLLP